MASAAPHRVLIVDDHADTTRVIAQLLARRGYSVTTAYTLAQARQHCAQATFDTIFCDIQLPDGEGTDLAAELKSASAPTRLVAVTGHGMAHEVESFLAAGFDVCLIKPVHLQDILDTLPAEAAATPAATGHTSPASCAAGRTPASG
jgi:CheY-like chemotaxis protein